MKSIKAEETVVDAQMLKRLRDLGYTGGKDLPKDEAFTKFPDIKELLPAFNRTNEALQLRELGQFENAERLLATTVKEQPALSMSRLFLAETLAQQAMTIRDNPQARSDKFEQAVDACNALIDREKKLEIPEKEQTWEVYLIKGGALAELGRDADCEVAYRYAEHIQPKSAKVQMQLGMGRLRKPEMRKQAIKNLEAAIELDKELFLAHLVLGKFYLEQNRIDDALARFQSAAKYNPKLLEAHMLIAQILATRDQWPEAVKQIELATAAAPQDARLRQVLDEFRKQQKLHQRAEK